MRPTTKGIFVPPVVMYSKDGSLNTQEQARYFKWLEASGITGLFLNGSSGDCVKLTAREKLSIAEVASAEVPAMYRIAGVIEPSLAMARELADEYWNAGADAIAVCPPFYFKMTQSAIIDYVSALADSSKCPILLYDIPAFTTGMDEETILVLAKHPNVVGMKDSSRNFVRFESLLAKIKPTRPDFRIFTGTEELLLASLVVGGDGATVVTAGISPADVLAIVSAFEKGDIPAAREIQLKLLPQIAEGFKGVFPAGFRKLVAKRGFNVGPDR